MAGAQIDHIVFSVHDLDAAADDCARLGFTATPRAHHPWGTDNRLVQFSGANFIELVEVAHPELIQEHQPDRDPPWFSFGAFNRDFLCDASGMSMMVLASTDAKADHARFRAAGLWEFERFGFERKAPQVDGTSLDVAFELAHTALPGTTHAGFFTCHNKFPENFWKPEFQRHANGATAIVEAVLVAPVPADLNQAAAAYAGSQAAAIDGGFRVPCGDHALTILDPAAAERRFGELVGDGPAIRFIAMGIEIGSIDAVESLTVEGDRPQRAGGRLTITPAGLGGTILEFVQS